MSLTFTISTSPHSTSHNTKSFFPTDWIFHPRCRLFSFIYNFKPAALADFTLFLLPNPIRSSEKVRSTCSWEILSKQSSFNQWKPRKNKIRGPVSRLLIFFFFFLPSPTLIFWENRCEVDKADERGFPLTFSLCIGKGRKNCF